jgi:hypothetical protein
MALFSLSTNIFLMFSKDFLILAALAPLSEYFDVWNPKIKPRDADYVLFYFSLLSQYGQML